MLRYEEIVLNMNNMAEAVVVLKNPFQSIRNLVKKERGTAKPKWEVKVYVVLRLPVYAQQVPVCGVDWYKGKGRFQVRFGHKTPRAQRWQYRDCVINTNVLQRTRFLWDVVVYTIPFGVGEMINSTPFCRVFLGTMPMG